MNVPISKSLNSKVLQIQWILQFFKLPTPTFIDSVTLYYNYRLRFATHNVLSQPCHNLKDTGRWSWLRPQCSTCDSGLVTKVQCVSKEVPAPHINTSPPVWLKRSVAILIITLSTPQLGNERRNLLTNHQLLFTQDSGPLQFNTLMAAL